MIRWISLIVAMLMVVAVPRDGPAQTKSMTVSNTLTQNKTARQLKTTVTIPVKWQTPLHWRVTVNGVERGQATDSGPAPFVLVDTVWEVFPTAVKYRVTAYNRTRTDSIYRTVSVSRSETAIERARKDTFPSEGIKPVVCGGWGYKMPHAARDSARRASLRRVKSPAESLAINRQWEAVTALPDSLPAGPMQLGKMITARLGFTYPVHLLAKNRFTGDVVELPTQNRLATSTSHFTVAVGGPPARASPSCAHEIVEYRLMR